MSTTRRPSTGELLGWALAGLGVGLAAGYMLGEWMGAVDRPRLRRTGARLRGTSGPVVAPLGPAAAARAARAALAGDTSLHGLDLEPVGVGPGVVELHGWVTARALRARAARVVAAVPGIETVTNCLLVRGEDDTHPELDVTGQTA